jgi:uncharacterized protein YbjT (DUF2867 family)
VSTTVLITGASGKVSGALLEELRDKPDVHVRALVRDQAKGDALRARGVEVVIGDLGDPGSLPAVLDGVDGVWMLTPLEPRAPELAMNLQWAAQRAGVRFVVRLSAFSAAYESTIRTERLHALSDAALMASKLDWTILRPCFLMQNVMMFAGSVAGAGVLRLHTGTARVGMIDLRDIASVAARVIESPAEHAGTIRTLTGPEAITIEDCAQAVSDAIGRPVRPVPIVADELRTYLARSPLTPWRIDTVIEYGEALSAGIGDFTTSDVADITGRPPRSIREFAVDNAAVFTGDARGRGRAGVPA